MSLWNKIVSKLREIISSMIGGKDIAEALNVTYAISPDMENAINLWSKMYQDKSPWLREPDDISPIRVTSLGLASMIASEKARLALLEFESEVSTPTEEVEIPNPDFPGDQQQAVGCIFCNSGFQTMLKVRG